MENIKKTLELKQYITFNLLYPKNIIIKLIYLKDNL